MQIRLKQIIPFPLQDMNHENSAIWERDFSFESRKSYGISAPSGTGKTSLISILYGLRKDFHGSFLIDETASEFMSTSDWIIIRRTKISLCPQGLWLFDDLSALENIQLKNALTLQKSEDEIQNMLQKAGMAAHQHKKAGILSYGQKQRIAIIRALSQPFKFILLDEAFSHLDEENKLKMWELIQTEAKQQSAGIILTSLGGETLHSDISISL
ncbi:MAG: ATP-binding cassette domain-containing protein [Bacteroidales bacterium]|jgi:putative ABC transport system ATP-binding protein|nr:ATP-binding cassette domain-containing protein [Bacteroidales bacterium]